MVCFIEQLPFHSTPVDTGGQAAGEDLYVCIYISFIYYMECLS